MLGNRRRDTSPEWAVRRLLHARGLRYRVDVPLAFDRRRRADITFTKAKVVVFIDGCFWHGCPQHYVPPKSHVEYWEPKIAANRARDVETAGRLREQGWTVLRFWEHEDPQEVAAMIERAVRGPQAHAGSGDEVADRPGEPPESSSWPR
jgi:DNA mismatch endonuclease (patch repair protein)